MQLVQFSRERISLKRVPQLISMQWTVPEIRELLRQV